MKRFLTGFVFAGSLIFISSCSKQNASAPSEPTAAGTNAPANFHLKWIAGEKLEEQLTDQQLFLVTDTGTNGSNRRELTRTQNYTLSVLNSLPDNSHDLQLQFGELKLDQISNGKSAAHFNSKELPQPNVTTRLDLLRKIPGSVVNARIDSLNKVISISGVDELIDTLSAGDANSRAVVSLVLSPTNVRDIVTRDEQLPGHPVKPGDHWDAHFEIQGDSVGTLAVTLDCAFAGWEEKDDHHCAVMKFSGSVAAKPAPGQTAAAIQLKNGRIHGTTWFDDAAGLIVGTTAEQTSDVEVSLSGKSYAAQVTETTTIKLLHVTLPPVAATH